jgi:hypothetical protein
MVSVAAKCRARLVEARPCEQHPLNLVVVRDVGPSLWRAHALAGNTLLDDCVVGHAWQLPRAK